VRPALGSFSNSALLFSTGILEIVPKCSGRRSMWAGRSDLPRRAYLILFLCFLVEFSKG
jgi:hypothetical protein